MATTERRGYNYVEILNICLGQLAAPDQPFSEVMDVTIYSELNRYNIFGQNSVVGAEDKLFWIALRNTIMVVGPELMDPQIR